MIVKGSHLEETKEVDQAGFFLMEAIVAMALFALLGLAFANSILFGIDARLRAVHRSAAMQIASDLMEEQSAIDPGTLTSANSFTDTIAWNGNNRMMFRRTLSLNVNSDSSRTISVTVTDLNSRIGGSTTVQSIIAPWGSQ